MCGRYTLFTDKEQLEILKIISQINEKHHGQPVKTGEIFPTNTAPILIDGDHTLSPIPCVWGFPGFQGKSGVIINARAETAQEKRTFSQSLLQRRCLIPSTGFYEWDRQKQKYLFCLPGEDLLYMAGFYNEFQGERRFVILTTAANESVSGVHHRMPVVVRSGFAEDWVRDTSAALQYLRGPMPALSRAPA